MKRRALLRHLRRKGCELVCEGRRHSWWRSRAGDRRSALPRHTEINRILARKICVDLGVEQVP